MKMAEIGSLKDLLLFYTQERVLFNRMVRSIGSSGLQAKHAIALWLLLEEMGHRNLIRRIGSCDDKVIQMLLADALRCVGYILQGTGALSAEFVDAPVFSGLLDGPLSYRFFSHNREVLHRHHTGIMARVCDRIFGETLALEVDDHELPVVRPPGDGSGLRGLFSLCLHSERKREMLGIRGVGEQPKISDLNMMRYDEFSPGETQEDRRTMFLTFSKGHPLNRDQIIFFFNSKWGEVVEEVKIEEAQRGEDPKFGRITFKTALVIPRILNGQPKAKFVVDGKHLWARLYVPRPAHP